MVSAAKDPLTFDELMTTLIDFSKYVMNRLKIDNLTQAHLVGLVYELLKGTCTGSIDLEYNLEECFKALTNKLDWNNLEGDQFLKSSDPEKKYTTSITKTKAARYEIVGIKDMIVVRRVDRQLYKFKEGDFIDLHLNDIEDMLLLAVQHKLFELDGSDIVDFIVALHMFTKILIIKRRVEDLQLGVKSYKRNLISPNLKRPFVESKSKNFTFHHLTQLELFMKT
ncbi:hypothetical protein Tco_1221574 [Tanacetum coccineum]